MRQRCQVLIFPTSSFPGVLLQLISSNKTEESEEKLEFSSYVWKTACLLKLLTFRVHQKFALNMLMNKSAAFD